MRLSADLHNGESCWLLRMSLEPGRKLRKLTNLAACKHPESQQSENQVTEFYSCFHKKIENEQLTNFLGLQINQLLISSSTMQEAENIFVILDAFITFAD